jgi:plastocyanin
MCSDISNSGDSNQVRDGLSTTTPDANNVGAKNNAGTYLQGLHEPIDNYLSCQTRDRNLGLWTADREQLGQLNRNNKRSARFTRQNNNGNKHGFECPEERDYYPYWHPSPWRDVAVLLDPEEMHRCAWYRANSQNNVLKNYCWDPKEKEYVAANNEAECLSSGDYYWKASPPHKLAQDLVCRENTPGPQNHLGNAIGGQTANFNWTIPPQVDLGCSTLDTCACVLRIRYNMSSMVEWDFDYTKNNGASPVTQDPRVDVSGKELQLAIDTTQMGRTFQDRSHTFRVVARDILSGTGRIWNINVRGKRGNIVQTYPAVEYDFVPNSLAISVGDKVHWQWKGCDTNPNGNAGEGANGSDRTNVVQIGKMDSNFPIWTGDHNKAFGVPHLFWNDIEKNQMAGLNQYAVRASTREGCSPIVNNANQQDPDNCQKLNAAPDYFDGGVKSHFAGEYRYMSTRNNNFSNRGQKAALFVYNNLGALGIVAVVLASAMFIFVTIPVAILVGVARFAPHSTLANLFRKV